MTSDRWHRWDYKKPVAISGGIKSRYARGRTNCSNWWSCRWMEILEESIDPGRLSRGKGYARKGQVVDIEIEPGLVSASVQGTRKKPYKIKLGFETISDEAREMLLLRFQERASFAACLLAGEMPEEMEEVFKEASIPLFPDKSSFKRFKCTCPDEATPCKHIVAVLSLLGEVFDDDPFLLLSLRGVEKNELINLLTAESNEGGDDLDFYEDAAECACGLPAVSGGAPADVSVYSDAARDDAPLDENWYRAKLPALSCSKGEEMRRTASPDLLNEFLFWRGTLPFRESLKQYYERAYALASEILTGERRKPVGRPKRLS